MKTNIELARLAGYDDGIWPIIEEGLTRFAELVRADQREIDARICDSTYYQNIGQGFGEVRQGIAQCAAAIRAGTTDAT